jgi:endonuclease YncB( thermonuclease family)
MPIPIRTGPRCARRGLAALALLGLLEAAQPAAAAEPDCFEGAVEAIVANVADPRSIGLADGRVVRLAGVEPSSLLRPELHQAEADLESRLTKLVGETVRVRLIAGGPDRYGRLPGLVSAEGGLLQAALAREGLAIAFATGEPISCFDAILAAEEEARKSGRGLWVTASLPAARPEALAPFVGRFAIFEGTVLSVGNRRARTYLNFGTWWSEDVTVEIEARHRDRFGGEAGLAALAGQSVRVRGFVEARSGPVVTVASAMQIERLGAVGQANGDTP